VKRRSTEPGPAATPAAAAQDATALLRRGLDLGLADLACGRAELRQAAARCAELGDAQGRLLASCALMVFIGIADDDYTGFEEAAAVVSAGGAGLPPWSDPGDALLAEAGSLIAGWFNALDAPQLAAHAAAIAAALDDAAIAAPLRCCAGLAAVGYHDVGMDLAGVLWLELAMRPLLADAALSQRLVDEAFHMFVQSLYQCQDPERAVALRQRRQLAGPAPLPVIELKLALLDAQMALGSGDAAAGRAALQRAEPLLDPRAPRHAGWWHLLHSRLDLLGGHYRQALIHARVAVRLTSQSQLPERWMGVGVMQEGQVQMAQGDYLLAVPFFERAGRAASGAQAQFCWCLAHLARALHHFEAGDAVVGRQQLSAGLALARELNWQNFFRACPRVAAQVCAAGLEHHIETAFVHEVIHARGLDAVRPDLAAWPWPIRVRTLGRFQIELDGAPLVFAGRVARKPLELLQFVIASGGSDISASTVMFALWRELEGDKARAAFNVAMHRLRKLLAHDDAVVLKLGRLSLNPKCVWVDCLAFEQLADVAWAAAAGTLGAPAVQAAQRAVAMYGGHFLGETEDEPWQMAYRSRLASKFKRCVGALACHGLGQGDIAAVRALLERALELDPMAEDLARELMRLLGDSGEQAAALEVFARCRAAIAHGLDAKPSAATLQLVERIRAMG
jgi:DNA-binding SARP family transcriptional activator